VVLKKIIQAENGRQARPQHRNGSPAGVAHKTRRAVKSAAERATRKRSGGLCATAAGGAAARFILLVLTGRIKTVKSNPLGD